MSPVSDSNSLRFDAAHLAREVAPGIRILPVLHGRLEMTGIVRATLTALQPDGVALELPQMLGAAVDQAVARLPAVSVVVAEEGEADASAVGSPGEAVAWIVAPGDPFAEALRWAQESKRPRFLVDLDIPYHERHEDPVPDPYSLWSLGPERYLRLLADAADTKRRDRAGDSSTPSDALREAGMAFHIQTASQSLQGGVLLVLVGAAHAPGLVRLLGSPTAEPLLRRRRARIEVRHLHPKSLTGVLLDPPLAHAAFEVLRSEEPPLKPSPADLQDLAPVPVSLVRHGFRILTGQPAEDPVERAYKVVRHAAQQAHRYLGAASVPDRKGLGVVVWQVGQAAYSRQTQEHVAGWQRRLFFDFARRYARTQGLLVPGLYEWVVAARGVGDDNLAWEIFDVAQAYPWQSEEAEIPTARVDGDLLDLGTRRVRFRRRFFRIKRRPVPVRPHPRPQSPEDWLAGFTSGGLCSYPPEDLVIEDYGRFLQHKAVSILSVENTRTEPFTTSLLDGLDLRETLRRVSEGRVYVRESGRAPGQAGSVVVIFDPDREGNTFPHLMTWHGEHEQESDMAFYSTHPVEQVVGPGIMRATYGGFMLTHPPRRLVEVWQDPDYAAAESKPEILVMAAIDYSVEKVIVHVGRTSPSRRLHTYATAQGKRLLHIPLGSLSPRTLKKIRVVHLLVGRDKRKIAKDYLW